jgi:hypothetical protein
MKKFHPKRSFWYLLKVICFLLLSLNGWLRLQQALTYGSVIEELGIHPGVTYFVVSGVLMGLSGLAGGLFLWFRWAGADWVALGVAVVWLGVTWVERLFLSAAPEVLSNWPFMLSVTVLVLIILIYPLVRLPRRSSDDKK